MTKFQVTGPVAILRGDNKSERYLYKGAIFSDEGLDAVNVKHLQDVKLIVELPSDEEAEAAAAAEAEAARLASDAEDQERFDAAVQAAAEKLVADRDAAAAEAERLAAGTGQPGSTKTPTKPAAK